MWRDGSPRAPLAGMLNSAATVQESATFSKSLPQQLCFYVQYTQEKQNTCPRKICTQIFRVALFVRAKKVETSQTSIN